MYLSKSKYAQLWQCPKILWLDAKHPELRREEASVQARKTAGSEVGDLAKGLFGDFTEVTVMKDGRPDTSAMICKTQECIAAGVENICEASFSYNGLYCAVDILRAENGGRAIYEVKSSTGVHEQYGIDIAYQKYVLEHCGVNVTGTYLVYINSDYVRGEELDVTQLFQIVDMSDWVELEMPNIPERLKLAETVLDGDEPCMEIGEHCSHPYDCAYWGYCARHLPKPSVFDVYRLSEKKKWDYYRKGVVSFSALSCAPGLNEKQRRQIQFGISDCGTYIDKKGIQNFLATLSYPIYFLDFETMQLAVPQFPGTKPFQQIPFQYSLHYIEEPGGELKHKEFLGVSGEDPRRAIAERLCRDIPMHTCVTAYNRQFECGRINELALAFPDLSEHLVNIRSNIQDLLTPFQSGFYYNRAMGGSFSIKSVLPALYPEDPELDYHNLEGIHNGSEAMDIFPRIQHMPEEEQEKARQNLLAYCKLDTLAMVKVWQKLLEAATDIKPIAFEKAADLQGFWREGSGYDGEDAICKSIQRAVKDLMVRTLTVKDKRDWTPFDCLVGKIPFKGKASLAGRLRSYFEGTAPSGKDFDAWHQETCEYILSVLRKKYTEVHYGKAQKILNMTFKNMYCTKLGDKEEYFIHCHMPLDSYTLEWAYRNAYAFYRDSTKRKPTKTKTPSWSNLSGEQTETDSDGKYTYIFLTKLIRNYFQEYQKVYRNNLTVLQGEFVIWKEIQLELAAEGFHAQLLANYDEETQKKKTADFKKLDLREKLLAVQKCLAACELPT